MRAMAITLEQAKALRFGDIIHEDGASNADGSCRRWRVNGKVKTWKRSPGRVQVPLKYGLYKYDYLTENELGKVHLADECRD